MIYEKLQTGQLHPSTIVNCPVFIPENITDKLLTEIIVNDNCSITGCNISSVLGKPLELYFCKFFSGNESLKDGFADLPVVNIYLWKEAKIAQDIYVKQLSNDVNRFEKVLNLMMADNATTLNKIVSYNKIIQPKGSKLGIRKGRVRVGNPKIASYAFYAPPFEQVNQLIDNVLYFIHSTKVNVVDKALMSMMYFFFIHPFMDGNGRVFRALAISLLQEEIGLINTYVLILYFKNINPENYYLAQKSYREGNIKEIKNFHTKAIQWTNESTKLLSVFIEEYTNKVGQDKIDTDKNYSQVVIKTDARHKVDESIFQFHSKKAGKNIYINTGLLNVLNQFDYYLRYELRKHKLN